VHDVLVQQRVGEAVDLVAVGADEVHGAGVLLRQKSLPGGRRGETIKEELYCCEGNEACKFKSGWRSIARSTNSRDCSGYRTRGRLSREGEKRQRLVEGESR